MKSFQNVSIEWCVNYNSLHDICCFTIVIIESSVAATLLSLHNLVNSASVTLLSHKQRETLVAWTAWPWRPMITFRRYKFCCRRWHQQTRFSDCKKFIIQERSAPGPCKKCHDRLIVSSKRHTEAYGPFNGLGLKERNGCFSLHWIVICPAMLKSSVIFMLWNHCICVHSD